MRVRAIKKGYYVHLRLPGDVFDIADDTNEAGKVKEFSPRWMEVVPQDQPLFTLKTKGKVQQD
ncbi:MAG: hypothetical protein EHM80_02810 [Nitrospiraceae bacterium]|nr:MAG: hypothetical protein EHM80_02810 [Nitrospiraceae bacterium]